MTNRGVLSDGTPLPPAVVCGLGLNGLAVVRSLAGQGLRVIGVDRESQAVGMRSRRCRALTAPDWADPNGPFVDFLLDLGKKLARRTPGKPVLFGTTDEVVSLLALRHDALSERFVLTLPAGPAVHTLLDKRRFHQAIDRLGFGGPETFCPTSLDEARQASRQVPLPCIIKPVHSTAFCREFQTKVFRAESPDEVLAGYLRAVQAGHEVIIQETVLGPDTNLTGCVGRDGRLLGAFAFRRIRQQPRGFGNGTLVVGERQDRLMDLAARLLRDLGYYGLIDAEFKRDRRDGSLKFIEINPRTGWQNGLAARSGVNLPYLAYRDALGLDVQPVMCLREGVKWLYFHNDLKSVLQQRREEGLSLAQYVRSLRGVRAYAVWSGDDPGPFVSNLLLRARMLLRKAARKVQAAIRRLAPAGRSGVRLQPRTENEA